METGEISAKIDRGKHTTRHSEIIAMGDRTYIVDTPGFTSFDISDISKEELGRFYPEFVQYEPYCRFSRVRYENYKALYQELKENRRY